MHVTGLPFCILAVIQIQSLNKCSSRIRFTKSCKLLTLLLFLVKFLHEIYDFLSFVRSFFIACTSYNSLLSFGVSSSIYFIFSSSCFNFLFTNAALDNYVEERAHKDRNLWNEKRTKGANTEQANMKINKKKERTKYTIENNVRNTVSISLPFKNGEWQWCW